MDDKRNNKQVERFFQHNPIEDPLYLKKYVKDHPDHKMAWYLLGREYAAKGKEAKATYCFAQAGEIYEAFERQKVVVEKDDLDKVLLANSVSGSKRKGFEKKWKWGVLAALLIFIYIPASVDMTRNKSQAPEFVVETPAKSMEITEIHYGIGNWNLELAQMLVPKDKVWTNSVLIEGQKTPDGIWIKWYQSPRILLGVEHDEVNKSQTQIQYYDPKVCSCEAGDSSKLVPIVENWKQGREEAIILSSAIEAYQQQKGALPQKAEQLTEPFPNNLLPGLTANMKMLFPKVLKEKSDASTVAKSSESAAPVVSDPASGASETGEGTGKAAQPNQHQVPASAQSGLNDSLSTPFQEPLEILVDKEKHRLALVSGRFVIRSYTVGLGGDKTPEGEFIISEKVRNPNGKSNGDFGSRGMTLSDTLYAIHGTNKPASMGKDESLGCVRMLQGDIEELYDMVPQQTKVKIGKGIIPQSETGVESGKPAKPFKAPLETEDSNPKKKYKWLD